MTDAEAIETLRTQKRRYTFGNDEFSLEAAYHDCKLVFDGITDDDSFQEADTGLILYYANEIIYALHEALEGKDTNVLSDDCISRQAAIDALKNQMSDWNDLYNIPVRRSIVILEQLPSAQPERKPGKWEIYIISMFDGEGCRCSECGFEGAPYWDFCPNCGADMREKHERLN